jgi:hypothetical protein
MAELELVQIDVHADTVEALPKSLHLVLHDTLGMSGHSRCNPKDLLSYLVLHEQPHYSDYSRKDHATFDPHLVLHHIPGHSRHRGRRVARRRRRCRLLLRGPERHPPATIAIVVAIRGTPCSIRLRVPGSLAVDRAARSLAITDSRVRQKPTPTLRAGTFLPHGDHHHRRTPPRSAVGHF